MVNLAYPFKRRGSLTKWLATLVMIHRFLITLTVNSIKAKDE
jgi:hypothetical protein